MKRFLVASGILVAFCFILSVRNACAIPAFARKYSTTCVTCHAPFPKLSPFGEAFRLNGFQIPGGQEELYVKEQPVSLGAEAYKRMFPKSIWPSTIPGIPPISIIAMDGMMVDATGTHQNSTTFNFGNTLHVHAGGAFGDSIAFWTGLEFNDGGEETEIEGFLMYKSFLSRWLGENYLNLRAGRVGNLEMSLPNLRWELSYQATDYLYGTELGLDNQPGFELNGFGRFWKYAVGIVKSDTENSERDYYAMLDFKIGGIGFDGSSGPAQAGGLAAPPEYWRDDSVSFGGFWYRSYDGPNADAFDRFGGDLQVRYWNLELAVGYTRGESNDQILPTIFADSPDPDAILALFPSSVYEDIWTVRGQYFVFPWMVSFARYEDVNVTNTSGLNKNRIVAGVAMLIRANIRLNIEGTYYFDNQPLDVPGVDPATIDADQAGFTIMWGF